MRQTRTLQRELEVNELDKSGELKVDLSFALKPDEPDCKVAGTLSLIAHCILPLIFTFLPEVRSTFRFQL